MFFGNVKVAKRAENFDMINFQSDSVIKLIRWDTGVGSSWTKVNQVVGYIDHFGPKKAMTVAGIYHVSSTIYDGLVSTFGYSVLLRGSRHGELVINSIMYEEVNEVK
jgi:hypothetical protein